MAKEHGIYGFAIYFKFNFSSEIIFILEKLADKNFYFPFFLIWNNEELENKSYNSRKGLLNKQGLYCKKLEIFIRIIYFNGIIKFFILFFISK